MLVTADGSVYTYTTNVPEDHSEVAALLGSWEQATLEQITAKHHTAELVTTVSESKLVEMVALIEQARRGELLYSYCCSDAGQTEP
ncbi:MAG: hypothetical protein JW751_30585 [Polyangiaceae bacterium]|nr:hypothetical protein [Polyangiaceae bacterium]